ncbi:MAG: hypothetical protein E7609_01555 [Ruminococcaceae bacterium]|nr:hypothetical protein [Oscillospiraceae bacterium]
MNDEKQKAGDISLRSPFLKKLDNFFYHYKWHTIIAAFLAVVILVCSLQTCSKEPYDVEIMYAGPKNLNDRQTVLDIQNAFAGFATDENGDGKTVARLVAYWVDETYYENAGEKAEGANVAHLANNSLTNEKAYHDEIQAGNLSICLVSPYLFYQVHKEGGFMRIDELFPELDESVYLKGESGSVNHYAVLLSKTPLGELPGLSTLPRDTILCLRKPAYHLLNASRLKKQHANAKAVFLNALGYKDIEN